MTPVSFRTLTPHRLIMGAWLTGALSVWLSAGLVGRVWLELLALVWLLPLAVYDIRRREVPHMACVAVPCFAAAAYAWASGHPHLAIIAALVVAISERQTIQHMHIRRIAMAGALAAAVALIPATGKAAPGAIAILGFWLAYELGWWAGADALVAITLALLWPGIELLLAMAGAHIGLLLLINLRRWQQLAPKAAPGRTLVPGLPVLALAVILWTATRLAAHST